MRDFVKGGWIGVFAGVRLPEQLIFLAMLLIWCVYMDRLLYDE